jgi:septum formation protein
MMPNIILASNSPRRKELLAMAGIHFSVQSKNVDEEHPQGVLLEEIPLHLARKKAHAFAGEISENDVVIGADTVVILNNKIYEKPTDRSDAINMLQELCGKTHTVVTGVCIFSTQKEVGFSKSTQVSFNQLSINEIAYYVDTFKPYDKAGSYACQEWIGAVAINKFDGDYFNVVGLPVNEVYRILKSDFGYNNFA